MAAKASALYSKLLEILFVIIPIKIPTGSKTIVNKISPNPKCIPSKPNPVYKDSCVKIKPNKET